MVLYVVIGFVIFIIFFGMWNLDVNECYYGVVMVIVVEVVVKFFVFLVVGVFVVWFVVDGLVDILEWIEVFLIVGW